MKNLPHQIFRMRRKTSLLGSLGHDENCVGRWPSCWFLTLPTLRFLIVPKECGDSSNPVFPTVEQIEHNFQLVTLIETLR